MVVIDQYVVVPSSEVQHIPVPYGSKIVNCGYVNGQLVIWVMKINKYAEDYVYLRYLVVENAQPIDAEDYFPVYKGTIQAEGDIWHVLEMQEYEVKYKGD